MPAGRLGVTGKLGMSGRLEVTATMPGVAITKLLW